MSALCRAPCCASSSRATLAAFATRRHPRTTTSLARPRPCVAAFGTAAATTSPNDETYAPRQAYGTGIGQGYASSDAVVYRPTVDPQSLPFFTPPGLGNWQHAGKASGPSNSDPSGSSGTGRPNGAPQSPEAEVDDREWEMRVARGMLHLRETLPLLFETGPAARDLFPEDIYSKNVVLRLPQPFPLKVSSLQGYSVAFNIARNGMQALHSDLHATLERMTFSAPPNPASPQQAVREALLERAPPHRQKQIRVLLNVTGHPRLPPHKDATWRTSSLYTFSPYSGLIAVHEVETIRPLPGEGVADWLMKSLLGWTGRAGNASEGAVPCPRAIEVPIEREPIVRSSKKKK